MTEMKTLRDALHLMHRRAMGDREAVYMSIPPDPTRDADLLLAGALDELEQLRARVEASERANAALREALEKRHKHDFVGGPCDKPGHHECDCWRAADAALATDAGKGFVPRADLEAVQAHLNDVTTELHRQLDAMRAERDQFAADAEELRHCVKVMEREGGADIDWSDARNTSFGWSGQVRLEDGRRYYPHFLLDERDAARAEVARLREVLAKVAAGGRDGCVSPGTVEYIEAELAAAGATDPSLWLDEKLRGFGLRVATAAVEAQRLEHQTAEDLAAIVDAEVSR